MLCEFFLGGGGGARPAHPPLNPPLQNTRTDNEFNMTNIGVNLNENQFSNKSLTLSKKSLFCSIIGGFFIDKDYTHNVPSQESERSCVCVLKVYICASVCDSSIGL